MLYEARQPGQQAGNAESDQNTRHHSHLDELITDREESSRCQRL
jgi:hypothetical protein